MAQRRIPKTPPRRRAKRAARERPQSAPDARLVADQVTADAPEINVRAGDWMVRTSPVRLPGDDERTLAYHPPWPVSFNLIEAERRRDRGARVRRSIMGNLLRDDVNVGWYQPHNPGAVLAEHVLVPLGMADTSFAPTDEQRARLMSIHARTPDGGLVALPEIIRTADPMLTNDVQALPFLQTWGLGLHLMLEDLPGMRHAGTGDWAGICNSYYWIDRASGVTGAIFTQVLPFFDARIVELAGGFEQEVYAAVGVAATA